MSTNRLPNSEPTCLLNLKKIDIGLNQDPVCKKTISNSSWTPVILNIVSGIVLFAACFPFNKGYIIIPKTGFFCKDPSISYKHQGDTVGNFDIVIISLLLPLIVLIPLELLRSLKASKKRIRNLWLVYADYFLCGLLSWVFCTIVKVTIGYPRPDFLDMCQPDLAANCTPGEFVQNFKCQKSWSPWYEWMSVSSFFSGHAMLSVYSSLFSMYLIETRFSFHQHGSVLKITLQCLAMVWGIFASLSRYTDRRHHWWDVMFGALLGIFQAIYTIYVVHKKYELNTKEVIIKSDREECCCKCVYSD